MAYLAPELKINSDSSKTTQMRRQMTYLVPEFKSDSWLVPMTYLVLGLKIDSELVPIKRSIGLPPNNSK